MISTDVGFLSSLTIVNEWSSLTIVNEVLIKFNLYLLYSLPFWKNTVKQQYIYENIEVNMRVY